MEGIEGFSEAEVQRFETAREASRAKSKALFTESWTVMTMKERFAVMDAEFPDRNELGRYLAWSRADACLDSLYCPDMTAKEFAQEIDSVNLLQCKAEDTRRLIFAIGRIYQNPVAIGFESDIIYRLLPDPDRLLPQQDIVEVAAGRSLLPPSFLGINTTAQPQKPTPADRQKPNLSEISASNAESDDADPSGFVFFQLGYLEYVLLEEGEQGWPAADDGDEADDENEHHWENTNFCLVARVGPSGKAEGIYAVYDIFQNDEDVCDDERYLTPSGDCRWGKPPTSWGDKGDRFSCARVGDCLSDFGKDHRMVWADQIKDPIELVRVLRSGPGEDDRLDFGNQHQMVRTDKIKDLIESARVLRSGEDRLDFGNQHQMVWADKIKPVTEPV